MLPMYDTKTFSEIYDSVEDFLNDYGKLGLPKTISDINANNLYYLMFARYGNNPIANYDENQFKAKLQAVIWQYGPTWEKRLDMQTSIRALTLSDLQKGLTVDRTGSNTATASGSNSQDTTNSSTESITTSDTTIANHASNPGELDSETTIDIPELKYIDAQNTNRNNSTGSNTGSNTGKVSGTNSRDESSNSIFKEIHTKGVLDAYNELWELLDNDVTNDFLNKFRYLFKQFVRPERHMIYESED